MEIKYFADKKINIRKLNKNDLENPERFRIFMNSLIKENIEIVKQHPIAAKEQSDSLNAWLKNIKRKHSVYLLAESNDKVVGTGSISLGKERQNHIGNLGIMIKKDFRGVGLGNYLMKEILRLAKKELQPKPKALKLSVFATNKPAINLYNKYGFKKITSIPKQFQYKGKLVDEIIMLLDL